MSGVLFLSLVWGAPQWALPAAVLLVAALVALGWGYWKIHLPTRWKIASFGLKAAALILLALCLLEPQWSGQQPKPGDNVVILLGDNSQSMNVRGEGAETGLVEPLRDALQNTQAEWLVRLGQDFDLRRFLFDQRLQSVAEFAEWPCDGQASHMHTALQGISQRFRRRNMAGVLLFSDGNLTDLKSSADWQNLTGLPPVFPVVATASPPARDVTIHDLTVTQTNFEDAPVTLAAEVHSAGYGQKTLVCQLLDVGGKVLETQKQPAGDEKTPLVFRFQFRPAVPGVSFYQVRAAAEEELAMFQQPKKSPEATMANNQRLVMVDRGAGPYRVLYVSGRPNWEFKFLRRAIEEDHETHLVGLIRIAKREPKFDWRSRQGESSNPLFRGFKDKPEEEAERYDQPVLVRLGARDEKELRDGFPKTAEELFEYDAIVVDDLEAEFFQPEQMALLSRFVSERGGGFLMLGGMESFQEGQYARSPVADMLPVYLNMGLETTAPPSGYRLKLTREGWLQTWVRLRRNENDETKRLQEMPTFVTLNRVGSVIPGASALAAVSDGSQGTYPALVAQRFGRGQSAALLIGDLWRWKMRSEAGLDDLDKAWRQTIRWLVSDVPSRVEAETQPQPDQAQGAMLLQVRARNEDFQPLDNAAVSFTVTPPDGTPIKLTAEPSLNEAGLYEATYVSRAPGAYRTKAQVVDGGGGEVGQAESGWTYEPAAEEFRALGVNREQLAQLARRTGGRLVELDELPSFVADLRNQPHLITEPTITPLWHTPWLFALAVACLAGEWGLRRWKGVA